MSRKTQDNIACIVAILLFGIFLVMTMQMSSWRARLVPAPIAVISIILLLIQLYIQNFRPDIKLTVDSVDLFRIAEDVVEEEEEVEDWARKSRENAHGELNAFLVVFALFAMVMVLGILEGVFLFILGYFVIYGKEKILTSVVVSGGSTAVLYLLFMRLTSIEPWGGWIRLAFFS